jgi:hypothetical protein
VGQSSSHHDKCQVGDMHTYIFDLVHFGGIRSPFTHSFSFPSYRHVPVPIYVLVHVRVTVHVLVPVPVAVTGKIRSWTEEVIFQARGIFKRSCFRPVRNFYLSERIVGN